MSAAPDSHSIRYFAWLYSIPQERLALQALYGIEREVYESVRPGLDHHIAHSRLQWWREECERAAGGNPVHPLTRELVIALRGPRMSNGPKGAALPELSALVGFVDTATWDLAGATFETRKELAAYCERWGAAMLQPLLGPANPATLQGQPWGRVGSALRELQMLVDLARDAQSGRLRIPLDELGNAGADPVALAKPPWPEAVATMLRARQAALRRDLAEAAGSLGQDQQRAHRGLLVWAALAWHSSRRAEQALPSPLQPGRFAAIADTWLAWVAARGATAGRLKLS